MTAQPIVPGAHRMWTPDPVRQRLGNHTIGHDTTYSLVAESADELVLAKPFDIRLPIAEITP
jgi:hypothetical protein